MAYFTRRVAGTPYTRYYVGQLVAHGIFHVHAVQLSRPDGDEIAEPVRISLPAQSERGAARPIKRRLYVAEPIDRAGDVRRCPRCRQVLAATEFRRVHVRGAPQFQPYCRPCTRTYAQQYRAARKAKEPAHD